MIEINLNILFPNKKLLASFKNGKELRVKLNLKAEDEVKIICGEDKVVSSSFLSGLLHLILLNGLEKNIDLSAASNQIKTEFLYSRKKNRILINDEFLERKKMTIIEG